MSTEEETLTTLLNDASSMLEDARALTVRILDMVMTKTDKKEIPFKIGSNARLAWHFSLETSDHLDHMIFLIKQEITPEDKKE
jgi:hypothetical protein